METHGTLQVRIYNDPMFAENGLLLTAADGKQCWIIDPGLPPQPEEMTREIEREGLLPVAIVLTHCHGDHIAGVGPLVERFDGLRIIAPAEEAEMLTDATANRSAMFGFGIVAPPADEVIGPGTTIEMAGLQWDVLDVSGHSPGGLAFHSAAVGVAIVGDSLFAGGIGRYDFPGSSGPRLLANIREQLLTLPDETVIYPGHGPTSTIARERETNPFLQPGFVP